MIPSYLNGCVKYKEQVLEPFTLMAHKPNYILIGVYNSISYNPKLYQKHANDSSLEVVPLPTLAQSL